MAVEKYKVEDWVYVENTCLTSVNHNGDVRKISHITTGILYGFDSACTIYWLGKDGGRGEHESGLRFATNIEINKAIHK